MPLKRAGAILLEWFTLTAVSLTHSAARKPVSKLKKQSTAWIFSALNVTYISTLRKSWRFTWRRSIQLQTCQLLKRRGCLIKLVTWSWHQCMLKEVRRLPLCLLMHLIRPRPSVMTVTSSFLITLSLRSTIGVAILGDNFRYFLFSWLNIFIFVLRWRP